MAFVYCTQCGRKISDRATCCPGCGAPAVKVTQSPEMNDFNQQIKVVQQNNNELCLTHPIDNQNMSGTQFRDVICIDCGTKYSSNLESCPYCYCPTSESLKESQAAQITTQPTMSPMVQTQNTQIAKIATSPATSSESKECEAARLAQERIQREKYAQTSVQIKASIERQRADEEREVRQKKEISKRNNNI